MNWGWRIVMVYAIFMGGILYLVVKARHQRFDMVEKNYYQRELEFEKKLEASRNYNQLSERVEISHHNHSLTLAFPGKGVSGEVWVYCTHDSKLDIRMPLALDTAGQMHIATGALSAGHYLVQCNWETGGKPYYLQQSLNLP
jgi:hypothetical protein